MCGGWLRPHAPQAGQSPARSASCGCFHRCSQGRGARWRVLEKVCRRHDTLLNNCGGEVDEKGGAVGCEERGGVVWGKKFRFLRGFIFCLAHFFAILLIGYEIA